MNRLLFEKTGDAVYLSHLDLMRVFQRAFKRADIMIWHSQGFSPQASECWRRMKAPLRSST